jgi:PAS domain S-box-containing protein
MRGAPVRDARGRVVQWVGTTTDIDDQKRAEQASQRNEDRYRSLVLASAQIVWTTDAAGLVTEDSPSWRAFTGQTYEQWRGRGWLDALHPDDRLSAAAAWTRAVAAKTLYETEYRLRTARGDYRLTLARGVPVLEADGGIREWVGTNTDITDRKNTERALRESEARFRQLADAMPQIVWVTRPDGYHEYYNRRWYDYTGLTPEESIGFGWSLPLHPEDRRRSLERWDLACRSGEPYEIEYRFRAADGSYRWFLGRALPVRDESGRVTRWFGTCTDVDDQRRAREALQEADHRKDEFLATLAHELRNPLAPITNAVQIMALRGLDDPHLRWARDVVQRQTQQLSRLVDDLLDVSRITRGKVRLRQERVDLAAVVSRAVETSQPLLDAGRHALTVTPPPVPVYLEADPTRLAQVLSNLLNNAAKYQEPGGRVWLSAGREGGEAVLRVRDAGVGIAPEMLPRVFDLFAQADRSLDRSQGGLGIGLSLVRALVRLHGGTVAAFSDGPGRGSEFVVRLPALDEGQPAGGPAAPGQAAACGGLCVLVVEDNPDGARSLALLLRWEGHEVLVAHEGQAALELARSRRPAVVLLDLGLPGMDGFEVARRLRREPGLERVLLVAVSGYGQEEDCRRAREAGCDAHLVKPADLAELRRLLAARAAAEDASAPAEGLN